MLEVYIKDRVGHIVLSRLDKKNALNFEFIRQIKSALDDAAVQPEVKVLVIQSKSDVFCAGADLEYLISLQKNSFEDNVADTRHIAELFDKIYNFPKLTIAMVEGHAIAGGCGIANAADFCFATPEAKFGYSEVKIGFIPAIVSVYLVRKIGEAKARELLLTGKLVAGEQALHYGLVNELHDKDTIHEFVEKFSQQLVQTTSEVSIKETKKLLMAIQNKSWEDALNAAIYANAHMRETSDFKKGLNSFIQKEKLIW